VGAMLFYADGRTDKRTEKKLTVAFRNFAKGTEKLTIHKNKLAFLPKFWEQITECLL
jgi:hypothetical protein